MNALMTRWLPLASILLGASNTHADEKPATAAEINGVKGVKQEAVQSIKKVEPPTANAAPVNKAEGVKKVDGINTINGVKAEAPHAAQPIPPKPAGSATNVAGGSVGAVSSIRAVKGVAGDRCAEATEPGGGASHQGRRRCPDRKRQSRGRGAFQRSARSAGKACARRRWTGGVPGV